MLSSPANATTFALACRKDWQPTPRRWRTCCPRRPIPAREFRIYGRRSLKSPQSDDRQQWRADDLWGISPETRRTPMALQDDITPDRNLRTLARWRSTARVLVEALPYILRYDGQTIVVKYGGNA